MVDHLQASLREQEVRELIAGELAGDGEREEITAPIDLLDRETSETDINEIALVRRLRRDSSDPLKLQDFVAKLAMQIHKFKVEERKNLREARSANQERANQLLELLDRVPSETASALRVEMKELADILGKIVPAVRSLQRTSKAVKWVLGAVLTVALGSLGTGFGVLWSRAEHEGETNAEIKRLHHDVELLLERRYQQPKDSP